jgi:hypothetical protein
MSGRLTKLVLMLSSDRDGEVVAAARAIGRALRAAGRDWHDFAGGLLDPAKKRADQQGRHDDGQHDSHADWRAMHKFCLRHESKLRSRELKFIYSIAHWRGELTSKQHRWLTAIHQRLRANE